MSSARSSPTGKSRSLSAADAWETPKPRKRNKVSGSPGLPPTPSPPAPHFSERTDKSRDARDARWSLSKDGRRDGSRSGGKDEPRRQRSNSGIEFKTNSGSKKPNSLPRHNRSFNERVKLTDYALIPHNQKRRGSSLTYHSADEPPLPPPWPLKQAIVPRLFSRLPTQPLPSYFERERLSQKHRLRELVATMLPNHFTVPIFATAAGSKLSHPVKTQVDSLKDAAAQAKSLATATVTIASTSSPAPAAAVAAPIATPRNDSTFASKTSNHKNPKTVKHADTSVVVAQKAANGNAHTTTATMTSYAATTSAASTTDTIDATTTITTTTTSTTSTTTNEPVKFQLNVNAPEWGGAPAVALRTKPAQPVPVAHKAKPTPPVPAPLTAVERARMARDARNGAALAEKLAPQPAVKAILLTPPPPKKKYWGDSSPEPSPDPTPRPSFSITPYRSPDQTSRTIVSSSLSPDLMPATPNINATYYSDDDTPVIPRTCDADLVRASPDAANFASPATTLDFSNAESSGDDDDEDLGDLSDVSEDFSGTRNPFEMTSPARSKASSALSGIFLFSDAILSEDESPFVSHAAHETTACEPSDIFRRREPLKLPLERMLFGVVVLALLSALAPASWGM